MNRSLKLRVILGLTLSFVAGGCGWSPWQNWRTPEVHAKPGTVIEIRRAITVPVVVRNAKGELVRAHVLVHPGWLVGPPPPMSEVK